MTEESKVPASAQRADIQVSLDNTCDPHQIKAQAVHSETKQVLGTVFVTFSAHSHPEVVFGCLKFALAHLDQVLHRVIIPPN